MLGLSKKKATSINIGKRLVLTFLEINICDISHCDHRKFNDEGSQTYSNRLKSGKIFICKGH